MKDFNIHEDGNEVLTESVLNGIDETNLLANITTSGVLDYTATSDCFAITSGSYTYVDINGIEITRSVNNILPLKKNDIIKLLGAAQSRSLKIYGIKR